MAAMFVAALAVPDAFGRHGVVFGVAFLIVNVMHLTLYALGARGDRDLLAAILRIAPLGPHRRGSDPRRGVRPRRAPADALAGRARRRLVRAAPRRPERLARAARALRRASRADRDHRDRRVPGRHRPRGEEHAGSAPA